MYNSIMRKIIIDPDICNGQPVIQGTRITASTVVFVIHRKGLNDGLGEFVADAGA
jgi:uncharacterized protein (DUF433 family)